MQDTKYYKTDTNFTKNFRLNEANSSCDCNFMTKPSKRSINLKNEINNYVTKINNIKNLKKKKLCLSIIRKWLRMVKLIFI